MRPQIESGSGRVEALIRYFFHENPDLLNDRDYVKRCIEVEVVAKALGWETK